MSAFVLKIIACITMFIDHIGYVIFDGASFFNYIGRIAFPIFAFQISQGYIHTKNIKKYFIRLLVFALVSQLPFMLFHSLLDDSFAINVIFTLLFGLTSITIYDKYNKLLGIVATIFLGLIANICKFDYGFYGVIIVLFFYIFRNNKTLLFISFVLSTVLSYAFRLLPFIDLGKSYLLYSVIWYMPYCICTIASALFLILYNNKKGYDSKYFLYLFYPLHLIFIYALSFVI